MINRYRWWEYLLIYLGMAVLLIFILAPFLEAFLVSLRPLDSLFSVPYRFVSDHMSFKAYVTMWQSVPLLWRYMLNSFFVAGSVTVLGLIAIIPAAYAFSRFEFRGRGLLMGAFLSVNMVSGAVLIIPLYKVMQSLGLLNSYISMIAPGVAFVIPTGIWLLRSYLVKIPKELEEAALVDGAGRLYILVRVIIPVALPGIMVVAITTFIAAYAQQFLYALTFNSVNELNPLPVGLYQFFGRQKVVWNELMAASLIGIIPVMLLYVFLQKFIVAGLTSGAVKE
ncbi:carbohydrate ABC transporter permease [Pseudooceanicola sp. CBS1P-1]|uniref:ABC transporter permease subunit n=1 Tax=Pseudooceanicola albus TaxID=2692189 RepID=A0A6L7G559_9RHOB|nr:MULTISPECIES: carbohydrate ABC transporter permease [Pseudooceanicola]MBT9385208.1 carbohydrate ABC transporter permease [Pseudooceanicola endophyticus]MXN18500.1 ABC transporter permease subunit [Pseudooceanicola albus]